MREWLRCGGISFRRIRHSTITQNILALYGTQIAAYAFPLATVPYLARVLGPIHWGLVALAQAWGLYLSTVVEFGFQLSATRRIARIRENRDQLEEIAAGVMGAKVLLAIVCLAVVPILQQFVRPFRQHALFLWAGSLSGIGQGFSMLWFYQGMERMKTAARVDVCGKAAVAAGIFFFVHDQNDAWKVLALQCVGYGGTSVALLVMAYRNIRFRWPTPRATARALRESAAMFLFRSAVSLYTTANALILGAVGTPLAVGLYSGAERIIKALLGLLNPISQSVYPRLNRLLARDHERAVVLARASLGIMLLGGFAMCFGVIIAAPLIVRAVLGPGYGSAIPVIRVLSLLLPAIALSNVLGIQWMLPLGLDAAFNKIIVSAGFLNLGLALWWAHRWQQMGMAWAVVASECTVTLAMMAVLVRNRLNPLSDPRALESTIHEKVAAVEC